MRSCSNSLGTQAARRVDETPVPQDRVGVVKDGRDSQLVADEDPGDGERSGYTEGSWEGRVDVKVAEEGQQDMGAPEQRQRRQDFRRGRRQLFRWEISGA
jgi:hypothetical protein